MVTVITKTAIISSPMIEVDSMGYSDWWCPCGVLKPQCTAAYRAKGAASLSASYVNLANPGTYDLTGATPTWDAGIGWTSYVSFTVLLDLITLPMTFAWRGKVVNSSSGNTQIVFAQSLWDGLLGLSGGGGNFIMGMNLSVNVAFVVTIADFSIQHTFVYQKLSNNYQNLWIDGSLQAGSPKAGTTPTSFDFGLVTGDAKCESAALYNVALTEEQVVNLTDAMEAL